MTVEQAIEQHCQIEYSERAAQIPELVCIFANTMRYLIPFLLLPLLSFAQPNNCASNRYLDPIFPNVHRNDDIEFANADPYGIFPNQTLYMDIYEPVGDALAARPVIVFAYGGAFTIGDKRQPPIPDWCEYYAQRGYVVAAIQYRIGFNQASGDSAERAVYRAVQDMRAALRYLAQHAGDWRIDIDHIFLTGTSAGAITAIHSTYMEENERPVSTYGIPLEPSDLGCADCSGNNDYNNQNVPVKGIVSYWAAIGDTTWIDPSQQNSVPITCIHGTADLAVPYAAGHPFQLPIWPTMYGSSLICQRMQNLGFRGELNPMPGAGHEPELLDGAYLDTMYLYATPFMYSLVRPITSAISGTVAPCQNTPYTYTVANHPGSTYCWSVTGGNIIAQNGNSVTVEWTAAGPQTIAVQELNYLVASGEPVSMNIQVGDPPAVAAFSVVQVDDFTFQFMDLSQNAAWLQINFGDGTPPQLLASGDTLTHTFPANGNYTVALTVFNSCNSDYEVQLLAVQAVGQMSLEKDAWKIWPNPTHSGVWLKGPIDLIENKEFVVFDAMGRLLLRNPLSDDFFIDLNGLPSGVLVVKVGERYFRVVKE